MKLQDYKKLTRIVIFPVDPLNEDELIAAYTVPNTDLQWIATLQLIDEMSREATEQAEESVGNPYISCSSNGGSQWLKLLRDRIIDLREKGIALKRG